MIFQSLRTGKWMKIARFRDDVSIKHSFMFTLKKLFSDGKNHSYKVLQYKGES
jgi:hypothetical protein